MSPNGPRIVSQATVVFTFVEDAEGRRVVDFRSYGSPEGTNEAEELVDAMLRLFADVYRREAESSAPDATPQEPAP